MFVQLSSLIYWLLTRIPSLVYAIVYVVHLGVNEIIQVSLGHYQYAKNITEFGLKLRNWSQWWLHD